MELLINKCKKCGKIIVTLKKSACPTFCCDEPMAQLIAGTTDAAVEKHVPVVEQSGNICKVTVGSVNHPMEEKHFIEWLILQTEKGFQLKNLKPGEEPKSEFLLTGDDKFEKAYAYCNLHGLWASK